MLCFGMTVDEITAKVNALLLLPGESLLFTGGLLAAKGTLDIWVLAPSVALAAILGDQTGYFIGRRIGPALFKNPDARFLTPGNVDKTHAFFEKYGPRSIILARFVPIVRTFITLLAGVGKMDFRQYVIYSSIGGVLWAGTNGGLARLEQGLHDNYMSGGSIITDPRRLRLLPKEALHDRDL